MAFRVSAFAWAAGMCLALVPVAAWADEPDAGALFKSAMLDLGEKKLDRACPAFRESYKLDPQPKVLFYLAQCEEQSGRVSTALGIYDDYLARFDKLSPTDQKDEGQREQQATERREALLAVLPKVTLKLPGDAPDGTRLARLSRDGVYVPLALNVALPVDPGEVIIRVQAPGRPDWDHRFFINRGDQKTVEVPVPPPDRRVDRAARVGKPLEPVRTELPLLEKDSSGQRVAAYVAVGVGAVGILAGAVTGAITLGQKGPIEDNCESKFCNLDGQAASDTASTFGTASTVSFAIGGAALATGLVLYLTLPAPAKLAGAPARVAVRGNRVEVGWQW